MVEIINGNIFTSQCQTIVNTINCVGVMGAGIALECRLRYPEMYTKYVALCASKKIDIGMLWLSKANDKWILNFPTKKHWKYPSKIEYLHAGLQKFSDTYQARGIQSIAFPMLGADRGGIPVDKSMGIMLSYLEMLPIKIEIYHYDRLAKDDLFDSTKKWLLSHDVDYITEVTGLRKNYIEIVLDAMQSTNIVQLNQLSTVKGIGVKTLEKLFDAARQGTDLELDVNKSNQSVLCV